MNELRFAFADSAAASLENSLLSGAFFERLIYARGEEEAAGILADGGVEGYFPGADPDEVLSRYSEKAYREIIEISPDKTVLDAVILKNDFHNLKSAVKSFVMGKSTIQSPLFPSVFPPEALFEAVKKKEYGELPAFIAGCAETAYDTLSETGSARLFDTVVDSFALDAAVTEAKRSGSPFTERLLFAEAELASLKMALRFIENGYTEAVINAAFPECVGKEKFIRTVRTGETGALFADSSFPHLAASAEKGTAEFEKAAEKCLFELLSEEASKPFGPEKLIVYYKLRENEKKNLAIVLGSLKAGLLPEKIRERLGGNYV